MIKQKKKGCKLADETNSHPNHHHGQSGLGSNQ